MRCHSTSSLEQFGGCCTALPFLSVAVFKKSRDTSDCSKRLEEHSILSGGEGGGEGKEGKGCWKFEEEAEGVAKSGGGLDGGTAWCSWKIAWVPVSFIAKYVKSRSSSLCHLHIDCCDSLQLEKRKAKHSNIYFMYDRTSFLLSSAIKKA